MSLRFFSPLPAVVAAAFLTVPSFAAAQCPSDCNGDGRTAINELIRAVRIALDDDPVSVCPAADTDFDQSVAINELIQGVNAALQGCPPATTFDGPIGFNVDSEDPLILEVPLDNGQTISLFGTVDAGGVPSRVTSAVVRGPSETWTALFDASGVVAQVRVEGGSSHPMARYDLSWLTPGLVQIDFSDMGALGSELPLRASTVVDLGVAGAARAVASPSSPGLADLGGVASFLPPETLSVTIRDCDDLPIGDVAHVRILATWRDAGGQVTDMGVFDGQEILPGDFQVKVPVRRVEPLPGVEERQQLCRGFATLVENACQAADAVYIASPQICIALQAAVTAASASAGVVITPVSVPGCIIALSATSAFCELVGTPPGVPGPLGAGCDVLYDANQQVAYVIERQYGETVELVPEVVFDNGLVVPGPLQTLPSVDPATSFDYLVGAPQILDLRTDPAVPALGAPYQLIAEMSCIPTGSRVFLSARDPSTGAPPARLIESFEGSGAVCLGVPSDGPGAPAGGYHESVLRVTGPGLPGGQELSAQRAVMFQE